MGSARLRYIGLALLTLLACERGAGCGERPLARLIVSQGEVSRDFRGRELVWSQAPLGAEFSYGDALRTAKGSLAHVRVGEKSRVVIESETLVRFLDRAPTAKQASPGLQVTQGSALIEAFDEELSLQTRSGTAVLKPGTKVELRPAAQADNYRVLMGNVTFTQEDGQTHAVGAGHSIAIGIGAAVFEDGEAKPISQPSAAKPSAGVAPDAGQLADASSNAADASSNAGDAVAEPSITTAVAPPSAAAPDAEPTTPDPPARPRDRTIEAAPSGPAHLTVPIGETFAVYDLHAPTHITFNLNGQCSGEAALRFSNGFEVRGTDKLGINARAGTHSYELYCLEAGRAGKRRARGSFQIVQAAGARTLPKTAPHNQVALDGHRYRLMYQNLRPIIAVSWPGAPSADAYTLTLQPEAGAAKAYELSKPEYVLPASALRDGKLLLSMQAHDAEQTRSKPTSVDIAFDNAAPTASLELPAASGFAIDAPVEVRGSALEGTLVTVEGELVSLDKQRGFSHLLTLSPERPALTVRFQDRVHGIRYYVRRTLASAR